MKVISAEVSLYKLRNGEDMNIEAAAAITSNILTFHPSLCANITWWSR